MSRFKPRLTAKRVTREFRGYRFRGAELPGLDRKAMSKRADRSGQRFGRLVAIESLGTAPRGHRWWGCVCDCGTRIAVQGRDLSREHIQSCGCLTADRVVGKPSTNRLAPGVAAFRAYYGQYRRSAANRNIAFGLTSEEFAKLTKADCSYCGCPPSKDYSGGPNTNGTYLCNGVDRFNNSLGYTVENSRPCCAECNMAKGRMKPARWLAWLARIAIHRAPGIQDLRKRPLFIENKSFGDPAPDDPERIAMSDEPSLLDGVAA